MTMPATPTEKRATCECPREGCAFMAAISIGPLSNETDSRRYVAAVVRKHLRIAHGEDYFRDPVDPNDARIEGE